MPDTPTLQDLTVATDWARMLYEAERGRAENEDLRLHMDAYADECAALITALEQIGGKVIPAPAPSWREEPADDAHRSAALQRAEDRILARCEELLTGGVLNDYAASLVARMSRLSAERRGLMRRYSEPLRRLA